MNAFFQRTGRYIPAILLISSVLVSCQSTRDQTSKFVEPMINQELLTEEGEMILVGRINREGLAREDYRYWFEDEYNYYVVDEQALAGLSAAVQTTEIWVFLGTWCSDSQRELPRFYKIMDALGIPESRLNVIGLDNHPDRYKQSPQHEEVGWNIEYVPTFVFVRDGKEIGRIVEAPLESLERDLAGMLRSGGLVN
jgi:thiol-disulfide isomerase/thioredoxin